MTIIVIVVLFVMVKLKKKPKNFNMSVDTKYIVKKKQFYHFQPTVNLK